MPAGCPRRRKQQPVSGSRTALLHGRQCPAGTGSHDRERDETGSTRGFSSTLWKRQRRATSRRRRRWACCTRTERGGTELRRVERVAIPWQSRAQRMGAAQRGPLRQCQRNDAGEIVGFAEPYAGAEGRRQSSSGPRVRGRRRPGTLPPKSKGSRREFASTARGRAESTIAWSAMAAV